uniref:ImmA/IrrE family metallo-endopeptidase n=1 Tax=Acetatifactor sp. TaxID=1872090 RepID=UPI004056D77B
MAYTLEQTLQANYFAMVLLMPERQFTEIVKKYTDENGMCNTKYVAKHFGVSISMASLRGHDLGLFQNRDVIGKNPGAEETSGLTE